MTKGPIEVSKGAKYWLDNYSKSQKGIDLALKLIMLEEVDIEMTQAIEDAVCVLRSELTLVGGANGYSNMRDFVKYLLETKNYKERVFGGK